MQKIIIVTVLAFLSACGDVTAKLSLTVSTGSNTAPVAVTTVTAAKEVFVSSSFDKKETHSMVAGNSSFVFTYQVAGDVEKQTLSFTDGNLTLSGNAITVYVDGVRFCNWNQYELVVDKKVSEVCKDAPKPIVENKRRDGMLATAEERWGLLSTITYNSIVEAANAGRMVWMTRDIEVGSISDMRNQILQLKKDAPGLKVACYVNAREVMNNAERPWQKAVYDDLNTNHPDYFLKWDDGARVVAWTKPVMEMINLMNPAVRAYIISKISELISRKENHGLCDEIHFDNMVWVNEWLPLYVGQGKKIIGTDGKALSNWDFGVQWREAIRLLAVEAGTTLKLPISGRAKEQMLLKKGAINRVYFERALKSDIPGGVLGGIMQARLISKHGDCVLHHDVKELSPSDPQYAQKVSAAIEDGYAAALASGCAYAFNLQGDLGNGGFIFHKKILRDPGKFISFELPYPVRDSLLGENQLTGGQSFRPLTAMNGDQLIFWRDIQGGVEGQSYLTGISSDTFWSSGFWSSVLSSITSTLNIGFSNGPGTETSEDLYVLDAGNSTAKGYITVLFSLVEVFCNVTGQVKTVTALSGETVTLQPAGTYGYCRVVAR